MARNQSNYALQDISSALTREIANNLNKKGLFNKVEINASSTENSLVLDGYVKSVKMKGGVSPVICVHGRLYDAMTNEVLVEFKHKDADVLFVNNATSKLAEHIACFIKRLHGRNKAAG